jgi:hypothetical protein
MSHESPTPREQASVAAVAAQMSSSEAILQELRTHIEIANQLMVVLHERGLLAQIHYMPFPTVEEARAAKGVPLHARVSVQRRPPNVTPPILHAHAVPSR